MLRRLLACLALITGFAAVGAPAQAEVVTAVAARVEATASASVLAHRQSLAAVAINEIAPCFNPFDGYVDGGSDVPVAPVVRIGSDRARE